MKRRRAYRIAGIAVLVVVAAAGVAVVASPGTGRRARCTAHSPAGGAVLVTSVAVLAAAEFALVRQCRTKDDDPSERQDRAACARCGREVYREWRMCPYCGAIVDKDPKEKESEASIWD